MPQTGWRPEYALSEEARGLFEQEFGSLTDQQPTERHPVRPWIAEVLEEAFDDWHCNVVALDVHRTFWERATILHSEHHRPAEKPMPDRFSRHYADTVALAQDRVASTALGQGDLLTASLPGSADSSAARGLATTLRGQIRSGWRRRRSEKLPFGRTTRPCATCT
jgi:hypothetical protein